MLLLFTEKKALFCPLELSGKSCGGSIYYTLFKSPKVCKNVVSLIYSGKGFFFFTVPLFQFSTPSTTAGSFLKIFAGFLSSQKKMMEGYIRVCQTNLRGTVQFCKNVRSSTDLKCLIVVEVHSVRRLCVKGSDFSEPRGFCSGGGQSACVVDFAFCSQRSVDKCLRPRVLSW